ncbi:MAG: type II toxin-antitoxin system HicB family antitoxin [Pseudomonadota bacterium]
MHFTYPALLAPDAAGGYVVTFRDIPEAITQGDNLQEALREAADCLEEAIAGRIDDKETIPQPSALESGEYHVAVPIETALKAALYQAVTELGITNVELARRIQADEKVARRLLDPHHGSKPNLMEKALAAVGHRLNLRFSSEAAHR